MKSREIKVQLNKASRADAEPSPRKTDEKEPEWVAKRKSVSINAPVKIEKDIVTKEGKLYTLRKPNGTNEIFVLYKFCYLEDFFFVSFDPYKLT